MLYLLCNHRRNTFQAGNSKVLTDLMRTAGERGRGLPSLVLC